jgi:hypothetical protein
MRPAPRRDDPTQERAPDEQITRELVAPHERAIEAVAQHDLREHAREHAGERRDRKRIDDARRRSCQGRHA